MFLVCGEALFDLFPAAAPAAEPAFAARPGGSPLNVAIGLARLGVSTGFFGAVSTDALGQRLAGLLAREGVDARHLRRAGRPTTLSLVALGPGGAPSYTFYGTGSADAGVSLADLPAEDADFSGLHFGSYSIVVRPVADALAALARRERRRLISLDPNVRPTVEPDMDVWRARVETLAGHASLVKASDEDLALLYPGAAPDEAAERILGLGAAAVVVTEGPRGAVAFRRIGSTRVSAPRVPVVDTVGAGDAFQAALLARLLALGIGGRDDLAGLGADRLREALAFAARAAALVCQRRGADFPRAGEIV